MKPFRLIIICLTFCILSSILTVCIASVLLRDKQSYPVNKKDRAQDLYSASITFCSFFEKCGHTLSDSASGTTTYSSTEELTKRFPGYKITSGEGEEIVMTAVIDNYCPHHYKAILSEDEITIKNLCNQEKITSFKIITHALSENEKSLLRQGVTLDSKKALTSFIEDFTS